MQVKCLNCNAGYTGKFCPECGQKSSTHRITFAAILHDIPHSVLHIDKGFFFTFKELLVRPGKAISEYLEGKRIRHFSPLTYLLILSAISSFVRHQAITHQDERFVTNDQLLFPGLAEFFDRYPALMLCVMVPFIAFWSWLFNKDKQYNYWENLILNIYLIAQFNLFFVIYNLAKLMDIWRSGKVTPLLLCFIGYLTFAYMQFFPRRKMSTKGVLKNIALFLLISFTFITGLSITGFMTPWWGNVHW